MGYDTGHRASERKSFEEIISSPENPVCYGCDHISSWHRANQKQTDVETGRKYVRVCYGIGCTCEVFEKKIKP